MASRDGDREGVRTLPVNLLLKGRSCLLVGAGTVALRKAKNLLAHGARVALVAPDAVPGLRDLASAGAIELREGRYDPALLSEFTPFLVYAATDDDKTNRQIVMDASERGILASSVSCWEAGDFISPSVLRWGRGQVSITTEGASCRQAKFMRVRLEELLGGDRDLLLVGVDQRSIGFEAFERVRPDAVEQERRIAMLRHLGALEEFVLLATCNRLELYAWTRREPELVDAIQEMLGIAALGDRVLVRTGEDVITHAANVVAGHLSEVICETQVTGQFKDAFKRAFEQDVAGVHMQQLHDRVLTLSKKIRARQDAERAGLPTLVSRAVAARLDTAGRRVLVLGAGGLGCEVADALSVLPGTDLTWANRTVERMPEAPPCKRLALEDALGRLDGFDQVVSVLGAAGPVIRETHLPTAGPAPVFHDLGLPRNVEPSLAESRYVEINDLSFFRHADEGDQERTRLLRLTESVLLEATAAHG